MTITNHHLDDTGHALLTGMLRDGWGLTDAMHRTGLVAALLSASPTRPSETVLVTSAAAEFIDTADLESGAWRTLSRDEPVALVALGHLPLGQMAH